MPLRIGKYSSDYDCWGILHNLYHKTLLYVPEYIHISTTNPVIPPTLKAGSCFQIYKCVNETVSTSVSGNNVVSPSDTINTFLGEAVYTPDDQIYSWSSSNVTLWSGGYPQSYYMVCRGAEDVSSTSLGKARIVYVPTYTTQYIFSYDYAKGVVPYTTNNDRLLARFQVNSSGHIFNMKQYQNMVEHTTPVMINTYTTASVYVHVVSLETKIEPNDRISLEVLCERSSRWVDSASFCTSSICGISNYNMGTTSSLGMGIVVTDDYIVHVYQNANVCSGISWLELFNSSYGAKYFRLTKTKGM